MKVKSAYLGCACVSASLALGASLAAAQDYPQTSTLAERSQTQQLNQQGTSGIDISRQTTDEVSELQQDQIPTISSSNIRTSSSGISSNARNIIRNTDNTLGM